MPKENEITTWIPELNEWVSSQLRQFSTGRPFLGVDSLASMIHEPTLPSLSEVLGGAVSSAQLLFFSWDFRIIKKSKFCIFNFLSIFKNQAKNRRWDGRIYRNSCILKLCRLVMECTDKHEKKVLISHWAIISEQMVTVISSRELTAFFQNTPLLPVLQ